MKKLVEALKKNGVEVVVSENPEEEVKKFKDAFVCEAASAAEDVGIIFFVGLENRRRVALADHHVAIVRKEDVKEDVVSAYFHALSKGEHVFASSSPSKTADIEGKLVYGMHGPRKFTVILEKITEST